MDTNTIRMITTGLLFLGIFISGFSLKQAGKPYPGLLFNLHKLIGLAAVAFLIVIVYQIKHINTIGRLETIALIFTFFFFADTIISGGLVSIDKPVPPIISLMHRLLPYATLLSTAAALYLLLGNG